MDELKQKTILGLLYKFAERVGAQGINFIISLLLARLLMPEAYGIIALVTVFISIFDVFVTYGFGSSLIANKNSDSVDFSTCFYFSGILSIIVYLGIYYFAPKLANYYNSEILVSVIRVMALRIPIGAINTIQHAYVSKNMMFKKFFQATFIGTIVSGVIAVIMAYMGCGIWSLVEQYIGNVVIDTICLWFSLEWRPTFAFSIIRLKNIYQYGWKILVTGLIDTGYNQLRSLIIAKKFTSEDLAYYNKGSSFPAFGMQLIEPTIDGVIFPALSKCSGQRDKMRAITRRMIKVSTYVVFPVMVGLVVVAEALVKVLLTEKWTSCVIYLQIGCLAYMLRPIQVINNSVIKASGNSGLLLRLDIVKKCIGTVILLMSMRKGIVGIAISLIIVYFVSTIINITPNRKILGYGYSQQFLDVCRNMILAMTMGVIIYPISFIDIHPLLVLLFQTMAGVIVYIGLSFISKNESFFYIITNVKIIRDKYQ